MNREIGEYDIKEVNDMLDKNIIESQLPEGKTLKDFTGGHVNILKNSSKVVLYFGYKEGSKHPVSVNVKIEKQDENLWFKVLQFKRDMLNKSDGSVNLAELMMKASLDVKDEPMKKGEVSSDPFGSKKK